MGMATLTMSGENSAVPNETKSDETKNTKKSVSEDFMEAKSNWLKLMFSEKLYETLFSAIDSTRQLPEPAREKMIHDILEEFFGEFFAEMECMDLTAEVNLVKDAIKKHNSHFQATIPVLSEEEILSNMKEELI
jgi:hypothetical protein